MSDRPVTIEFSADIKSRLVRLGAMMVALLAIFGCGKKAPPVAPQLPSLLAVNDLRAKAEGAGVTLTWQHPPENGKAAGYLVLRAQVHMSQAQCPGCPQVFQKVQTLRLSRSRRQQAHTLTFNQVLADGFRYTYSVRPFHASGRQGPDSNLVEIVRWPSDLTVPGKDNS